MRREYIDRSLVPLAKFLNLVEWLIEKRALPEEGASNCVFVRCWCSRSGSSYFGFEFQPAAYSIHRGVAQTMSSHVFAFVIKHTKKNGGQLMCLRPSNTYKKQPSWFLPPKKWCSYLSTVGIRRRGKEKKGKKSRKHNTHPAFDYYAHYPTLNEDECVSWRFARLFLLFSLCFSHFSFILVYISRRTPRSLDVCKPSSASYGDETEWPVYSTLPLLDYILIENVCIYGYLYVCIHIQL